MTLRSDFVRTHPEFPLLVAGDVSALAKVASMRGWLAPGEGVRRCDRAGEGNMNLTLRVETDRRSFILKQARPWVEKYDEIPAPIERAHFERKFYELTRTLAGVADRMPALLHADREACMLMLEDLGDGRDLTPLYRGGRLEPAEVDTLADYLRALHDGTRFDADHGSRRDSRSAHVGARACEDPAEFANGAMRALNHEHLFLVPLSGDPPAPPDAVAPGLARAAEALRADAAYRQCVRETSERYVGHGAAAEDDDRRLLHGDYFPGSWLRTAKGLFVIDPEFAFPGDREIDVGCAAAHFALANRPFENARRFFARYELGNDRPLDAKRLARYASVEVMRRLIGVAQLPLPSDADGSRAALLKRSRRAMLSGEVKALFA